MESIIQALGGLAIFLLGMIIMTDGLHSLAGHRMRDWLMRFTRSPLSGAATGAASTAVLQSSSATTVAAVGFVSAGLIGFQESLGIIFGANIGTTITGWMVALFGFKLKLGSLALPLLFIAVLLRLIFKHTLRYVGMALAGFSLIFIGIGMMQQGMAEWEGIIQPHMLPQDSIGGRFMLVFFGIIMTLITQSSSAGVATAITALHAGAINFHQAAALIIGMDIGTTVTAVMATIGGTRNALRTGLSHVVYNLFTGSMALLLISPFVLLVNSINPSLLQQHAELILVAFHTSFNTLGVVIALPLTHQLARLMMRLVPDKPLSYTRKLDLNLLEQTELALNASQQAVHAELLALLAHINAILSNQIGGKLSSPSDLLTALDNTQQYIDDIKPDPDNQYSHGRLLDQMHTLDHLRRLYERCEEEEDRALTAREHHKDISLILSNSIQHILTLIDSNRWTDADHYAQKIAKQLEEQTETLREAILEQAAINAIPVQAATSQLQALRWLGRVSIHISRITHHLGQSILNTGQGPS